MSVSVAGFEPTISCARGTRISRLSHTLMIARGLPQTTLHPAGVEPAHPPWRDGTLPLRHRCIHSGRIVKEQVARRANDVPLQNIRDRGRKSTGWDSNPRCRVTSAESSPLDDQCAFPVGPDGLEPSPARVRTECAAANTLIPCCSQWGRRDSNPRRAR